MKLQDILKDSFNISESETNEDVKLVSYGEWDSMSHMFFITRLEEEYGIRLTPELDNDYDAVIVSVPHEPYTKFNDDYFKSITKEHALIADLKGIYRNKITSRKYWSF